MAENKTHQGLSNMFEMHTLKGSFFFSFCLSLFPPAVSWHMYFKADLLTGHTKKLISISYEAQNYATSPITAFFF